MRLTFSEEIKSLLQRLAHQPLTLGDVLETTSQRGFILVIALLVLPFLFPMPPGLTGPLGSACLLLSLQMLLGRRSPWLPKKKQKIANYQFPRVFAQTILHNLGRVTRLLEKNCPSSLDKNWQIMISLGDVTAFVFPGWLSYLFLLYL